MTPSSPSIPSVSPLKHVFTHAMLATGYVAYDFRAEQASPIHALTAFLFVTAIVLFLSRRRVLIRSICTPKFLRVGLIAGVLYSFYFLFLLIGIKDSDASSAILLMSLSVCTNGIVAVRAIHKKLDAHLVTFTVCIFLVVVLIKSKGNPGFATLGWSTGAIFIALLFEATNTCIRTILCPKHSLKPDEVAQIGLALAVIPALLFLAVDTFIVTGWNNTVQKVLTYDGWVYVTWVFLGVVPNLFMLTWAIQCEKANAVLFQSLSSIKVLCGALYMLIFPTLYGKSIFVPFTSQVFFLVGLLVLLIYLYNKADELIRLVPRNHS